MRKKIYVARAQKLKIGKLEFEFIYAFIAAL